MKDYIPPEVFTAAVRGLYTALLSGVATGVTTWLATDDGEAALGVGILAFVLAQGGRVIEGARDARRAGQ